MEGTLPNINREKKAKDIISWNIAMSQASLNIFCMEATFSIANRKKELKRQHRRYLAGKAQMEYQFGDPAFDDSIWEEKTNAAINKKQKIHEAKIRKMTNEYKKKSNILKQEISDSDQQIIDLKKSIEESKSILEKSVPYFDIDVVGDFNELRKKIEEENQKIRNLEQMQSQYNQDSHPLSLQEVLLSTQPNLYKK